MNDHRLGVGARVGDIAGCIQEDFADKFGMGWQVHEKDEEEADDINC